jgi:hypothetical protein
MHYITNDAKGHRGGDNGWNYRGEGSQSHRMYT